MANYMNIAAGITLVGAALALTGCGEKIDYTIPDGVCSIDGETGLHITEDVDCNDSTCDAGVADSPDGDCSCNTSDPDDIDCEFCDYPENANHPDCLELDPFVPDQVAVNGLVTFDPSNETTTDFVVDGNPVPTAIDITIYDERLGTTQNIIYQCGLSLVPTAANPGTGFHEFAFDLGSGENDYVHYGLTLPQGSFDVVNRPIPTQSGTSPGCLDIANDPVRHFTGQFGEDEASFTALFTGQDWGIYWGEPAGEIVDYLGDPQRDEANNDYDLYSLYTGSPSYVIGGSNQATNIGTGPIHYTYGFALDEAFQLIDSGNADDPDLRLTASDMEGVQGEEGQLPARGVYFIRTLYVWFPVILTGR